MIITVLPSYTIINYIYKCTWIFVTANNKETYAYKNY